MSPSDGKIKWGFQHTPNDPYDFDSIAENTFVDTQVNGKFTRATIHSNRNGYVYAHDRKTGEPLWCTQFVDKLNWSGGLDAKCKPKSYDPKKDVQTYMPGTAAAPYMGSAACAPMIGDVAATRDAVPGRPVAGLVDPPADRLRLPAGALA